MIDIIIFCFIGILFSTLVGLFIIPILSVPYNISELDRSKFRRKSVSMKITDMRYYEAYNKRLMLFEKNKNIFNYKYVFYMSLIIIILKLLICFPISMICGWFISVFLITLNIRGVN